VESGLRDLGHLAQLLVLNTSYPTHSLDRLWYLHSWNRAAVTLFQIDEETACQRTHLLELVFGMSYRRRFPRWENLARRLVNDFQYNTRTLRHLSEYKELSKKLRELPEFRRIAAATYAEGKPTPSFVFRMHHSQLGCLVLRTATTVFTGITTCSMVSYVPGDLQTLEVFRQYQWQQTSFCSSFSSDCVIS
jgi:hypothetical protein